jgi:hypothetical protein
MQPNRITESEKNKITDANLHLFVARHINDYWPCAINSQRMTDFLESQLGCPLVEWPYPLHLDQIETAFAYLNSQHMLHPRPEEEPEPEAQSVTRERLAQQKVRDDYTARQRAEQVQIAKTMPLNELRKVVGVGDAAQRARRSVAERTQDDRESNRLTPQELDARARARHAVMVANPSLNRNSLEFSKLVAEEMAK